MAPTLKTCHFFLAAAGPAQQPCRTSLHRPLPVGQELYFSEYDLAFFKHRHQMLRHVRKCRILHPPGAEIYRNGNISMFEVGGIRCLGGQGWVRQQTAGRWRRCQAG